MIWVFLLIQICHSVSSSNGKQVQTCLGSLVQIDFQSVAFSVVDSSNIEVSITGNEVIFSVVGVDSAVDILLVVGDNAVVTSSVVDNDVAAIVVVIGPSVVLISLVVDDIFVVVT